MPTDTLLAVLRQHPFVEEFQPEHIEKLASLAREVTFERDQVIFREGGESHDFHLIIGGRVALEIEVPACPTENTSYSLSSHRGKPDRPW